MLVTQYSRLELLTKIEEIISTHMKVVIVLLILAKMAVFGSKAFVEEEAQTFQTKFKLELWLILTNIW